MMKANILLVSMFVLGSANAETSDGVDPAPSGRELSEIHTFERSTVEMPGKDTPAHVERERNTTHIDFDPKDHVGTADQSDTTIVRE